MKASRSEPQVNLATDKPAERREGAGAPGRDYFALLGTPASFDIDVDALGANFRRLQQQFHPDRFSDRSAVEQRLAASTSADINAAYAILRDPLTRARYLLAHRGVDVDALEREPLPPAFLMQQLELREAIQACRDATAPVPPDVQGEIDALYDGSLSELGQAFSADDLTAAGAAWLKLLYIDKLRADCRRASHAG